MRTIAAQAAASHHDLGRCSIGSLDTWQHGALLGSDHDFWDPLEVPGLRSAATSYPDARSFKLGIDERTPGVVVVYLVDHGT